MPRIEGKASPTTNIFCGFIVELSVYTMTLINYLYPLKLGNEANMRELASNINFWRKIS